MPLYEDLTLWWCWWWGRRKLHPLWYFGFWIPPPWCLLDQGRKPKSWCNQFLAPDLNWGAGNVWGSSFRYELMTFWILLSLLRKYNPTTFKFPHQGTIFYILVTWDVGKGRLIVWWRGQDNSLTFHEKLLVIFSLVCTLWKTYFDIFSMGGLKLSCCEGW